MAEDEMVGWHHWLDGHGFGWTLGVGDGQGGLVCCSSWGRKELDMTEQLNCDLSSLAFLMIYSACNLSRVTIHSFGLLLSNFEPVSCLMSCSVTSWLACMFLRSEVRWCCTPISKNFPLFVGIHTVKGFCVVNETEVDVFLKLPCFLHEPTNVGNLISACKCITIFTHSYFLNSIFFSGFSFFASKIHFILMFFDEVLLIENSLSPFFNPFTWILVITGL